MTKRTKYAKHDKPLTTDQMKPLERPFGFASRPIRDGKVERSSKSRRFVPAKSSEASVRTMNDKWQRDLSEAKVEYSEKGERTVTYHRRKSTTRKVKWGKRYYSVPKGICGEPCDIG